MWSKLVVTVLDLDISYTLIVQPLDNIQTYKILKIVEVDLEMWFLGELTSCI